MFICFESSVIQFTNIIKKSNCCNNSTFLLSTVYRLLNLSCDKECYCAARDVGVEFDALVEDSHIFGVVGHLHNTLFAHLHGAFGVLDTDATARGFGVRDDEGCSARIGKFKEVRDLLATLCERTEVVAQLIEGYFGSLNFVFGYYAQAAQDGQYNQSYKHCSFHG